jgi:hypothetical protein
MNDWLQLSSRESQKKFFKQKIQEKIKELKRRSRAIDTDIRQLAKLRSK